jgi:hypothetical protein
VCPARNFSVNNEGWISTILNSSGYVIHVSGRPGCGVWLASDEALDQGLASKPTSETNTTEQMMRLNIAVMLVLILVLMLAVACSESDPTDQGPDADITDQGDQPEDDSTDSDTSDPDSDDTDVQDIGGDALQDQDTELDDMMQPDNRMQLVRLDKDAYPDALCSDGSPGAFYIRPGGERIEIDG